LNPQNHQPPNSSGTTLVPPSPRLHLNPLSVPDRAIVLRFFPSGYTSAGCTVPAVVPTAATRTPESPPGTLCLSDLRISTGIPPPTKQLSFRPPVPPLRLHVGRLHCTRRCPHSSHPHARVPTLCLSALRISTGAPTKQLSSFPVKNTPADSGPRRGGAGNVEPVCVKNRCHPHRMPFHIPIDGKCIC